jgi:cell cycle control protein 50
MSDTFQQPVLIGSSQNSTYNFTDKGIAWPGEAKKYVNTPGYKNLSEIIPPPNWALRFPNGSNSTNIPQLRDDEHFQNWMRTAGLPTFTKLYFRNDHDVMSKGDYEISVFMSEFPPFLSFGASSQFPCCRI